MATLSTALSALSTLETLGSLAGSASSAPAPASGSAAPASEGPSWLTGIVAQVTVIVLGLIFVIVGLFSFSQIREGAATVAKAAAVAA
jgi:hypothetical protein